jgi:hypothetical protein
MSGQFKSYGVSLDGTDLFTIELLDERPVGFSVRIPELAIYTFGKTEQQAIERVLFHVLDKYQDLLNSPTPLDTDEQELLQLYRTRIIPALVERQIKRAAAHGWWQRIGSFLRGGDSWRSVFLEGLKTSLRPLPA